MELLFSSSGAEIVPEGKKKRRILLQCLNRRYKKSDNDGSWFHLTRAPVTDRKTLV
jgi:hypothetical protein